MARIAINGLGRIGKLVLRDLIDSGSGGEIVLLNDPAGDAEQRPRALDHARRRSRKRAGAEWPEHRPDA
jgi:glyceraldehyde 3-phosphate dehydrogenase